VTRLVLGTAGFGDDSSTLRLLDRFHAAGGRAIDLANVYGEGDAMRGVGRWLRLRGRRDDVVLYAKGCHPPFCSPELVADEVEKALALLGVDRLDVFLLHRDDPAVPVEAWAEALEAQVARGTIRGFGVSNWSRERMLALDGVRLIAVSNHFSLAEMAAPPWPGCLAVDAAALRELEGSGVVVLAWASLAGGYFAGRDASDPVVKRSWDTDANRARRARAAELADSLGATTSTVALAYVLGQPEHVRPVFGTRSEEHLTEALAAEALELTAEQIAWLEAGR
jgi:aryl-alcohol dehydrogenase-like predicted oxidoreductase